MVMICACKQNRYEFIYKKRVKTELGNLKLKSSVVHSSPTCRFGHGANLFSLLLFNIANIKFTIAQLDQYLPYHIAALVYSANSCRIYKQC